MTVGQGMIGLVVLAFALVGLGVTVWDLWKDVRKSRQWHRFVRRVNRR